MERSDHKSERSVKSTWYLIWSTTAVLLLIAAAGFGILVANGRIVVRFPTKPPLPAKQPAPTPLPSGPSVRRVNDASRYFEIMNYDGSLFEYTNGFVDCWVEVEVDGKKQVMRELKGADLGPRPGSIRGYILFVRYRVPLGPRGPGQKEEELFDLRMTVEEHEEQGSVGVGMVACPVPEFKSRGPSASPERSAQTTRSSLGVYFVRERHAGGPLRPGDELVLYENKEGIRTQDGPDGSTRVVRVQCRLASAGPMTRPATQPD